MTSDRKKPGVAFWATVVVVLVALYVASCGPVHCLYRKCGHPQLLGETIYAFYFPFGFVIQNSPPRIRDRIEKYHE